MLKHFKAGAALLGLAALAGLSSTAQAATVTASASVLDLSVSLLTLSNDSFLSDASTPFQSGFDTGTVLQSYFFNNTASNGNTSFADLHDGDAGPGVAPFTMTSAVHDGQAHASVLWSFDWVATATGTASIDLGYAFQALVANLAAGEAAVARSFVSVMLDGTSLHQDALNFFNSVEGDTDGFSSLHLAFDVVSGQTGSFTVTLASDAFAAPVPLPAALPLLGSALLGLFGIAGRRRRAAAA